MAAAAPDRLRTLVRQHARTSALLGVDFVPIGRAPQVLPSTEEPGIAGANDRDSAPPAPAAAVAPTPAQPLNAEVKPPPPPPRAAPISFGFFDESAAAKAVEARLLPRLDPTEAARLLAQLRARYEADAPHAHFVTDHTHIVFGEGDPAARLMFVGEAPGQEEDRTGRPFVGRAGQLLDKMITAMGLQRSQVYIANVLKTRPPNNATPTLEEAALCAPYLFAQIAIIRPEVIVSLGLPATRCLLSTTEAMNRLRGRWSVFPVPPSSALPLEGGSPVHETGYAIPVMPTYHPAFILRSYTAENRQKVWSDLQQAMDRLGLKAKAGEPAASEPA